MKMQRTTATGVIVGLCVVGMPGWTSPVAAQRAADGSRGSGYDRYNDARSYGWAYQGQGEYVWDAPTEDVIEYETDYFDYEPGEYDVGEYRADRRRADADVYERHGIEEYEIRDYEPGEYGDDDAFERPKRTRGDRGEAADANTADDVIYGDKFEYQYEIDADEDRRIRNEYGTPAKPPRAYRQRGYQRGDYQRDDYRRGEYRRGEYRRGEYRRGEYHRPRTQMRPYRQGRYDRNGVYGYDQMEFERDMDADFDRRPRYDTRYGTDYETGYDADYDTDFSILDRRYEYGIDDDDAFYGWSGDPYGYGNNGYVDEEAEDDSYQWRGYYYR